LNNYTKIKKVIWWLSIDNYFYFFIKNRKLSRFLKHFPYVRQMFGIKKILNHYNIDLIHLAQSFYAVAFLKSHGINNVEYLSDFLNNKFLELLNNINFHKENIVVYNPNKGYEFTKKIIERANDIKFIPIKNMTREEVINLLKSSKVYIDFGNHPGKDRIPREAAMCGCCVITNKKGAANFKEDVYIANEYKFADIEPNIDLIIQKIENCFLNYDHEVLKFDLYKERIGNEEKIFDKDLNSFISTLMGN
jgi:hypothetical protein